MTPSLLILTAQDVLKVSSSLSPDQLMRIMANAFRTLSGGDGVVSPQRTVIDNEHGQRRTLFMPTHAVGYGTAVKVVSLSTGTVANPATQRSKPGLNASTLVLDDDTGAFTALLNARHLTSLRTAAGM
jgi:ornithine cyclodeaminase